MSFLKRRSTSESNETFAALDIGSSKICCAIARVKNTPDSNTPSTKILGLGHQLSKGIKGSNIIDLEALEDAIVNAVHSAEQQSGDTIQEIFVNLPAGSALSQTFKNEINLSNTQVDNSHLRKLLSVSPTSLPHNRHVIHALPVSYELDGVRGIQDPRGMIGEKLSVNLHVISAPTGLVKNLMGCIGRCHLDIKGFVVSPYASGLSTLTEDEMQLGVTTIDMGGGHTTISSFYEGNLVFVASVPIGGNMITQDVARGITTTIAQAERLKTLYGSAVYTVSDDRENIIVSHVGDSNSEHANQISKGLLARIIRARVEEIFEMIIKTIRKSGVDPIVFQKFVITGGACQLQGMKELLSQVLGKPVRIGIPQNITGSGDLIHDPMFSTCAGLIQYGYQDYIEESSQAVRLKSGSLWSRMNSWFKQNF